MKLEVGEALQHEAEGGLRIDDIPEPETTDGTVKIKVDWCGICGTDPHEYLEGPIFTPVAGSPHPLSGEVAPGVTGFSEGEAVAVEPTLFCGRCAECRAGLTNLCPSLGFHGLSGGGGGYVDGTPKVEHSISFVRGCP